MGHLLDLAGILRLAPSLDGLDASSRAVWTIHEPGHYVLTAGAQVCGHIVEAPDGTFVSFDAGATPIARHRTLADAQLDMGGSTGSAGAIRSRLTVLAGTVAGALLALLVVVAEAAAPR